MNVSLTPQLENYIKQKVSLGMYSSVSEVVREALRLLQEKDSLRDTKFQALKEDIQEGLNSLSKGQGKPFDIEDIKVKGREALKEKLADK